jgi:hypothetical protein
MREVWRLNTVTHAWSQVNVDGLFPETMASFVGKLILNIEEKEFWGYSNLEAPMT